MLLHNPQHSKTVIALARESRGLDERQQASESCKADKAGAAISMRATYDEWGRGVKLRLGRAGDSDSLYCIMYDNVAGLWWLRAGGSAMVLRFPGSCFIKSNLAPGVSAG